VEALAARETVVHVASPEIHIAPPDVHVAVTLPPAPGKTVTRSSKVIRDDVGAIVGVDTTLTEET
jgi:hypothetical protein